MGNSWDWDGQLGKTRWATEFKNKIQQHGIYWKLLKSVWKSFFFPIFVYNKKDLLSQKEHKDKLYISALNKDVEPLKQAIIDKLNLSKENYDNPSIANTREIGLLENIKEILEHVLIDVETGLPIDLINSQLKNAYLKTLSITGEDNDFDIAKEIFSRFCVGK